eukprot:scpid60601/ scgid28383/ Tumor susceptibility gene 101 protein; ESCRT-I complex subunit TSG101
MPSVASTERFLKDHVSQYAHKDQVKSQVLGTVRVYSDLTTKREPYYHPDGTRSDWLNMVGTIPVVFKGTKYNIPIIIWIPDQFPAKPPLCLVQPTATMIVRPGRHVDANGTVYLPYLEDWKRGKSTLAGLVHIICGVFGEEPPVFSRPANQPFITSTAAHRTSGTAADATMATAGSSGGAARSVGASTCATSVAMPQPPPSFSTATSQQYPRMASGHLIRPTVAMPATTQAHTSSNPPVFHPMPSMVPTHGPPGAGTALPNHGQAPVAPVATAGTTPYPNLSRLPGQQAQPSLPSVTQSSGGGYVASSGPPNPGHVPFPAANAAPGPGYPSSAQPGIGQQAPYPQQTYFQPPSHPTGSGFAQAPHSGGLQPVSYPGHLSGHLAGSSPATTGSTTAGANTTYSAGAGGNGTGMATPSPAMSSSNALVPGVGGSSATGSLEATTVKASLVSAVEDKLRRNLASSEQAAQEDLSQLSGTHSELVDGGNRLQQMIDEMSAKQNELRASIEELKACQSEVHTANDRLQKLTDEQANVDAIVVADYPLHRQILDLLAEDNGIEDTLYYLGEGLRRDTIELDVFLKNVRELSRRQFFLRALITKAVVTSRTYEDA